MEPESCEVGKLNAERVVNVELDVATKLVARLPAVVVTSPVNAGKLLAWRVPVNCEVGRLKLDKVVRVELLLAVMLAAVPVVLWF